MKPRLAFITLSLLLLAALAATSGCTTTHAWERGTLADYTMRSDRDKLGTAMEEHIRFSREATSGGPSVGGGGCGCN